MMSYPVIQIEGIGEVYAEKLIAAGIKTTKDLLDKCACPKGREAVENETGIAHGLILKWANHADLMRIKGIGGQFAELLEAAGVDTVKELRNRKPANLQAKIAEVNEAKHLCKRTPALKEVEKMVAAAAELDPVMTY